MRISANNLRALIKEETEWFLFENVYREGVEEDLTEGKFETFTVAAALGILGALAIMEKGHGDEIRSRAEARAEQAAEYLNSFESHEQRMDKQLRNAAAFYWSTSDEGREFFPTHKFEGAEQLKGKRFQVLPPEYAIYNLVLNDKKNDNPRFGIPETPEEKDQLIANIKKLRDQTSNETTNAERTNFFEKFSSPKQFIQVSKVTPGLHSFGDPTIEAIVPTIAAVLQVYGDAPLPLKAMTAKDYYNAVYWGEHMTTQDYELIADQTADRLNPELIKKTKERADSLREKKVTWKNYKNRKKILA